MVYVEVAGSSRRAWCLGEVTVVGVDLVGGVNKIPSSELTIESTDCRDAVCLIHITYRRSD